jgi:uncharacterized protein YndB with AHSA1/START domain
VTERTSPTAVVTRVLPATPQVVYDEWLNAEALAEWMCPRPARPTRIEVDPRVDGRLRIDIEEAGSRFYVTGTYLVLDRPHRLSFTWSCSTWANPKLESVVTVTLEPHGPAQTLMTIHHALLPPPLVDDHQRGWAQIAKQLAHKLQVPSPTIA